MARVRVAIGLGVVLGLGAGAMAGEPCEAQWLDLFGPDTGLSSDAFCLEVYDDGTGPAIFVGGQFFNAGGVRVERIAKWNGTDWELLSGTAGNGVTVNAMEVFDDGSGPALFAGGTFNLAGGLTVNNIAKWNGVEWSPLTGSSGTGINIDGVNALEGFDDGTGPALYVGGSFTAAGGVAASRLARWDGSEWSAITTPEGNGVAGTVSALKVFNDGSGPALFVGGQFDLPGGVTAGGIAKWDGADWSLLSGPSGTGVSNRVEVMEVYDEGNGPVLFVGGTFFEAGGITATRIARWDGAEWSPIIASGGEEGLPATFGVLGMTLFDDGTGEKLGASGNFVNAGGLEARSIAAWDGTDWSVFEGPNGVGTGVRVFDVQSFETPEGPALFAAGDFGTAGGISSRFIAQWQACDPGPGPCDADATGDGNVDLADLNLVLANFGTMTSDGDTNGDGTVDLADLNAVLGSFGTPCE